MASALERLTAYVRKEIELVPAATQFNLRVLGSDPMGPASQLAGKYKVPEILPTSNLDEVAQKIAGDIMVQAKDLAQSMSLIAKFTVTSCLKEKNKPLKSRGFFQFVLQGKAREQVFGMDGNIGGESEPPNPTGLLGQLMRHLEAKERIQAEKEGSIMDAILKENQRLQKRVDMVDELWFKQRETLEELLDKSEERKLNRFREAADSQRKDLLTKKVIEEVIPEVAKRIPNILQSFGIKMDGQSPSSPSAQSPAAGLPAAETASKPDETMATIRDALSSLPDGKAEEFFNLLPQEKREKLLRLMGV